MTPDVPQDEHGVFPDDASVMQYALRIAAQGIGTVEPNPPVGAVITTPQRELIASGFHQRYGLDHAEINAIRNASGNTAGNDLYVTLEPCSHFGKTPPCADAVIQAGFRRVIIGCEDPSEKVAGQGIQKLRTAGIQVVSGICEPEAKRLIAPFQMLHCQRRPWVHAKWAMTMDGLIATPSGHSRWISGSASRRYAHQVRGQMDAIITGAGTVRCDDPLLTARPPGDRTALRVVLDSTGLSLDSSRQLLSTAREVPVLVCVTERASQHTIRTLKSAGAEVLTTEATANGQVSPQTVLRHLGSLNVTHVLLECGSTLMGAFFDAHLIDEIHVFIAPRIIGGADAPGPVGGAGLPQIPDPSNLTRCRWQQLDEDMLFEADIVRPDW
jgi:diaminohydroxyphosphoribosylaminopyrimidine deaminase / 5-amino-6-(5-phosphoribosylamino)uracil reductase